MHFAIVAQGIPNPTSSGSLMVNWTIIKSSMEAGHRVSCVLIKSPGDNSHPDHLEALNNLGVEVVLLESVPQLPTPSAAISKWRMWPKLIRKALQPTLKDIFPVVSIAPQMIEILSRLQPDAVYAFDHGQVAALQDFKIAPRMAVLGDPMHLVSRYALIYSQRLLSLSYVGQVLTNIGLSRLLPEYRPQ